MVLDDIINVLSRPSEPGNTGAVCRAMKNMGLSHLRIAAAEKPGIEHPGMGIPLNQQNNANGEKSFVNNSGDAAALALERLLARAVHASDIWSSAIHFNSLKDALADCTISVGTSRRRGRRRKSNTLSPRELAVFLKQKTGKAAIVFGNERTGLEREELELCNIASHIPASPEFPSINLSHAVQIYTYELYQCFAESASFSGPTPVPGQWVPMNSVEIENLVKKISNSLASLGFYKYPGREEQERFLRDLMARSGLSIHEGRYLGNIIAKAGRLEYHKS
jgi:tRNA/rRNA methyltransferase/tRNA (cytidine32/uridine32-2'-O)-methyltransferase